jgi:hypothetical protein
VRRFSCLIDAVKLVAKLSIVLMVILQPAIAVSAAGPANEAAVRNAWNLYTLQKYAESSDAFEALIRTSTPNARLYYYAALANKGANRKARAKQLCDYITTNFPNSSESAYVQKLFVPTTAADLPEILKGKKLEELIQTEEGRKALKEALSKNGANTPASPVVAATSSPSVSTPAVPAVRNQAFTAYSIAVDGPNGITQFGQDPNCWFECSMAALAMSPRGQQLIAGMIRSYGPDTYIVRFPGDGTEYTINKQKMDEWGVRDKALWATLIHCAQAMKYHSKDGGTIESGLSCLTGHTAENLHASTTTEQTLATFIRDAIKSQYPIVCSTSNSSVPDLVEADHAYTITAFDPTTNMITIKNPHGANSRRFRLITDPTHGVFEQLNDGYFKMHTSIFMQCFNQVARSAI